MSELNYIEMGTRIRQARKSKGWSQDTLAKRCGISAYFMGHIERGTRRMSMDTFVRLCRALDADADGLLWGSVRAAGGDLQEIWGEADQTKDDSYLIFVRIMKSVAEILRGREGTARCAGDDTGKKQRDLRLP